MTNTARNLPNPWSLPTATHALSPLSAQAFANVLARLELELSDYVVELNAELGLGLDDEREPLFLKSEFLERIGGDYRPPYRR